jgi:predicted dehydrogenase
MSENIAVVGCGYWGKNLVRNFAQLHALRWVCDAAEALLQAQTELYPDVRATTQFEAVLEDDQTRAVVIATPAALHYNQAKAAILRGKDVFVEKPVALRYHEGQELVALAEAHGVILMVGHILEYHPAVKRVRELVQSGELGRLWYIYSNRLNLGKVRREENILWSFAPHDIAVILRLLGDLPYEVIATGGSYLQPNIADTTITQLLFNNGVRAHIFVSWLHPFKEQRFVVVGEKNIVSFDDVEKRLILHHQHVDFDLQQMPVPIRGEGEEIQFANDEPLCLECQAFLKAIETRQPPLTDGHSALQVLHVLEAAQRSLITNGRPVTLGLPEGYLR